MPANPVHAARRDPTRVVLEGLHAVKHALRFGATLHGLWSDQPAAVLALARTLAPDLADNLAQRLTTVSEAVLAGMAVRVPETRLIGVAERPRIAVEAVGPGPLVVLDRPRHPGNLGAVVRVAAAADAAAVLSLGGVDPWSAAVVRGAAGLHFALPVMALDALPSFDRPILVFDDAGEVLEPADLPADGLYVFGSERDGVAPALCARATRLLALPMRPGVSSLNLATAVSAVLFAHRLWRRPGTGQPVRHCT